MTNKELHPQTLTQCEYTVSIVEFMTANNLCDITAMISTHIVKLYKIQVLAYGIQDDLNNITQFMMLR